MSTTSISSKGQITILIAVREALDVHAGNRDEFVPVAPGRFEIMAATQPVSQLKRHVRQTRQGRDDRGNERGPRQRGAGA